MGPINFGGLVWVGAIFAALPFTLLGIAVGWLI